MRELENKKLVLIDGNSIMNRAFYGIPYLTNSSGLHTNAIYGFLNIMFKIIEEEKPNFMAVAFDVKAPTFRHKKYEQYKGTRKAMPEELVEQMPVIKDVLSAMKISIVERAGYEADDILGTLAKTGERAGFRVSLVSGDRDLLQLASQTIKIRIPKTKQGSTQVEDYYSDDVKERYFVTPEQIIDLKGLMGDASDNIPGVPGIGEKTAVKILQSFDSIERAYEHIEEVMPARARESLRQHYDMAVLSKELATIKTDCELEFSPEEAGIEDIFNEDAYILLKKLEFKSLLDRFYSDVNHSNSIESCFVCITDKNEIEQVWSEIEKCPSEQIIGLQLVEENGEIFGVSVCYGEDKIKLLLEETCLEKIDKLQKQGTQIAVLDLKSLLPYVNAGEESSFLDIGVAAYLLNPVKESYYYDDIARDYLQMTVSSKNDLIGKLSLKNALKEKKDEVLQLTCYMAYTACFGSIEIFRQLEKCGMKKLYEEIEMPLIYTLYDMEQRGIKVNKEELKSYSEKLAKRIAEVESLIYEMAEEKFNINSPKQLGVILFEKMRMPFAKKTKTGYSTAADILEKLKCEHPIISLILEYRQLTKLKSTYADGLAVYIREEDQRIHGKFNQTITATGRISSTEPNLQNIPIRMELGREIRKVFIPEEGFVFLDADYSQIELRVLAHMSGDESLIHAYQEEEDIHRITAAKVFHIPPEEVTDLQRRNAKAVNFGIVYGISSFGLGQDLNITRKEAERYINDYFKTYPGVKEFLDKLVSDAKKDGYALTLFGRRRPVPELNSKNFMQRSFGERIAMNSPIQGTAADIIKIAMIRVNRRMKKMKLKSRLLLQIHDELLVETKKEEIEQVTRILTEEMHQAAELSVPLEIDINSGSSWFESK